LAFLDETEPWLRSQGLAAKQALRMDDKSSQSLKNYGSEDHKEPQGDSLSQSFDFPCDFMNRFVPIRARTRLIFYVIMVFFLNVIMYMGYDVMFSVFCEAPRYGGGLDFSPATTGLFMSVLGVAMMIWNIAFYKRLGAHLGTRGTVLFGLIGLFFLYVYFPVITFVDLFSESSESTGTLVLVVIAQAWRAVAGSSSTMACQVLITQVTPPEVLGQVNGYANAVTAVAKVLGPMCAGAIWSLLQTQDITPFLKVAGTYWTFAIIGISPVIAASKLPKVYQVQTGKIEKPLEPPELDEL